MIHLLIDFDGTVCDTKEGVMKSAKYAIEKLGVRFELDECDFATMFMGPPLVIPFGRIFNGDEQKIDLAVEYFRERYNVYGVSESKMYDGLTDCLQKIRDEGIHTYIASSKPQMFIHSILENNNAFKYFDGIYAPGLDAEKLTKYDIVKRAIDRINSDDNSPEIYMVGDRMYDVDGAHKAGIPCIGVKWGFAAENEFEEHGADYIVSSCEELYNFAHKLTLR